MWHSVIPFGNTLIAAVIALIPIIWIFLGILKFRLPSYKTAVISLAVGIVLALLFWKMPAVLAAESVAEGAALGFMPILWVIFAAIFTYNLLVKSGSMEKIKGMLSNITTDRRIQALIIGFAFGGFMEATAGFGTAVAIPVTILVSLGFEPVLACIICLTANTVPVAFGVVGIPVITLAQVTGLPLEGVSLDIAVQLFPLAVVLPFLLVVITTGKMKGLKGIIPLAAISGLVFALAQVFVVWIAGPELAALVASILTLAVIILYVKLFPAKEIWRFPDDIRDGKIEGFKTGLFEGLKTWSPYIFILVLVLCTRLIPGLAFLSKYPFAVKYLFYTGEGGTPLSFQLLTNPGTIILLSAVLGGLIQKLTLRDMLSVGWKTCRQIVETLVTVLSIVALSKLMGYSGMVSAIAAGMTSAAGPLFPFISPLIGALGTFITGSDTSSNILFGELQKQTAVQIGANPQWIAAANAAGATIGKMVSPQSMAIAVSAIGLKNSESRILRSSLKLALVFTVFMGLLVFIVK